MDETTKALVIKNIEIGSLRSERDALQARVGKLEQWLRDLHSGMYVNCVYCGHRYGPAQYTPVSLADVLKAHIEECPDHPLSKAMAACRASYKALQSGAPAEPVNDVTQYLLDGLIVYQALQALRDVPGVVPPPPPALAAGAMDEVVF